MGTSASQSPEPGITRRPFGAVDGQDVDLYTVANTGGMSFAIMSYGGIIQSIVVPDRAGTRANVALGFATLDEYVAKSPYFGATIGRFGNRIARGSFSLDGATYQLPLNEGPNTLHGGVKGFDKQIWRAEEAREGDAVGVRLSRTSPDGEEGFPGALAVQVTHLLTPDNAIRIEYRATTDRPTVLNLTDHTYFNLAGEGSGDIYSQVLQINADRYTPIDETLIPTGAVDPVAGTPFDFTTATAIGARIRENHLQLALAKGYDHNFVLTRPAPDDASLILAARAQDPVSGRVLEVYTTEPAIQFYAGNMLDGTLAGTGGRLYRQSDAFTLETQHFPDAPNQPHFPSTVLRPGQEFVSTTIYAFSA